MVTTIHDAASDAPLERFQSLLRALFRFESQDLDFGIYRILNAKRSQVERFVETDLPRIASEALEGLESASRESALEELARARSDVRAALGEEAVDARDALRAEYVNTPLGAKFVAAKAKSATLELTEETRAGIFNDLYAFFSRYYVDGDFMPRRRYGRDGGYVVPYRGENVLLYWANHDQYYVKSDDVFRAYSFRSGEAVIALILASEEDEEPNKVAAVEPREILEVEEDQEPATEQEAAAEGPKQAVEEAAEGAATKAHFVIAHADPLQWDPEHRVLRIFFAWRPLSASEKSRYPGTQQPKIQSGINEATLPTLLAHMDAEAELVAAFGGSTAVAETLTQHLGRFTQRNSADFFVHRDLEGFLARELDGYLATEVLRLPDVLSAEASASLQVKRARAVLAIGRAIISFLAQIENLQKALFEKPKFTVSSNYCVTIDRLSEDLVAAAMRSEGQRAEWVSSYGVTVGEGESAASLKALHPYLVVDTGHFDEEFKWSVLAQFDDVDGSLDGVLLKSESYHALRVLTPRYRRSIQAAYVDPPFNTENSQFLYRDSYRDSCWLTLMANRIEASKPLLRDDAAFFLHVDENSNYYARFLLDEIFGRASFGDEIIWRIGWVSGYKTRSPSFVRNHETIFLYGAHGKPFFAKDRMAIPYVDLDQSEVKDHIEGIVAAFKLKDPVFARQRLVFAAPDGTIYKVVASGSKSGQYWVEDTWNSNEYEQLDSNKIKRNVAEYTPHGSVLTQKPEQLLLRVLTATSNPGDWVLDFFAGSGTTAAVAKKIGRRFIAVEPGEYFDTDVLWRLKQVLWGRQVGVSRLVNHTGGGFFKYVTLETYADAIENLAFDETIGEMGETLFGQDYAVKYVFDAEARADLLPLSLTDPFGLTMKRAGTAGASVRVDLVETFNSLSGMYPRRYRSATHDGVRYRSILGEHDGATWAVVWRSLPQWDEQALTSDRAVLESHVIPGLCGDTTPDRIFVNAECILPRAESADALLRRLVTG